VQFKKLILNFTKHLQDAVEIYKLESETIMTVCSVLDTRYCRIRLSILQNGDWNRNSNFLLDSDTGNSIRIIVMIISEVQWEETTKYTPTHG
jgi:hypothetical protein